MARSRQTVDYCKKGEIIEMEDVELLNAFENSVESLAKKGKFSIESFTKSKTRSRMDERRIIAAIKKIML